MTRLTGSVLLFAMTATAAPEVIALPGQDPLISLRFVFRTGAAHDPKGKEGLAALTASLLSEGGTKSLTIQEINEKLYPMATGVRAQVDKEMTTFSAVVHRDNLEAFYAIFRDMLLAPGWRADDFQRVRQDTIDNIRVSLRGNNDEELAKEVLYERLYAGHPYGHLTLGHVAALEKLTIEDLQSFHKGRYTQNALTIAVAGGYPQGFVERVKKDFAALPAAMANAIRIGTPPMPQGVTVTLIDKETRSYGMSMGFPIAVRRGHADYLPLLVLQSWLGQHRNSGGRIYQRIREIRGLNYGDYAYIEYFPRGMYQFEPDPNLGRQSQIFQIWIRPVEPRTAHYTLRLALHEFERVLEEGMSEEDFQKTKNFLAKNVNLLTKTKMAELGYRIDSQYYGIPEYNAYVKQGLAKTTRADVLRAMKTHLQMKNMEIVIVGPEMEKFKAALLADTPSPITYNSPKPDDIVAEDKVVAARKLALDPARVRIVPEARVFE